MLPCSMCQCECAKMVYIYIKKKTAMSLSTVSGKQTTSHHCKHLTQAKLSAASSLKPLKTRSDQASIQFNLPHTVVSKNLFKSLKYLGLSTVTICHSFFWESGSPFHYTVKASPLKPLQKNERKKKKKLNSPAIWFGTFAAQLGVGGLNVCL